LKPVYLDYNATTPIDPRVAEAMLPFINEHFGNPSSSHFYGAEARKAVENSRAQIAGLLRCGVDEIIFTSGGTESNNFALKGAAFTRRQKGNHIITTSIEHPAVIEVCRFLEKNGFTVTYLPVDATGLVDPGDVANAITPQTILISVMHANNEVGTIQPLKEISEIARQNGIWLHSDCAQSVGKIPVTVDDLGVDLLSVAGHKLYAPKGVGVLFLRRGVQLTKQMHGANHERDQRAGTENVIEIVGLGKACELCGHDAEKNSSFLAGLRDELEQGILQRFPDSRINGHLALRLPNTSSISFRNLEANTILSELSAYVAASAGAACHSDHVDVSAVLSAMNVPLEYAMGTLRFSVGRFTTRQEIKQALHHISEIIEKLKPKDAIVPVSDISDKVRLTQFTHGLGCACKLRPQLLEAVLKRLPVPDNPDILVGVDTSDDAAVYRIDDHTAIVQTVDFFTPIVDDPYQFGRIAAVNSLSDIYAMGGKPLFALNVVGFPSNRLPMEVLYQILQGAQSVAEQAGIAIIGGHTVDDTEPKFGLAVTGIIHPQKVITNSAAKPGDVLILTKPIGTGILSTALKQGLLSDSQTELLTNTMSTLNKNAAGAMMKAGAHACTDITGFGLIGHLGEMMKGSNCSAKISCDRIPLLPDVLNFAAAGVIPGGSRDNFAFTSPFTIYHEGITELQKLILNDAQTSGGLLIAVSDANAALMMKSLQENEVENAVIIGSVSENTGSAITVLQ